MNSLNVAAPQLSWKPIGAPQLEHPVDVRLPPIRYDDGIEALEADAQKIGAYVYRLSASGEEIWNESEQCWADVPADPSTLPPLPLTYKAGDPLPWRGLLVAKGANDKDDHPRFEKEAGGEPRYLLRAFGRFQRDGGVCASLSDPSPVLAFVEAGESQRFGIELDPKEIQLTTRVRFKLKNAALVEAGFLEFRAAGGQEVEIVNCDVFGTRLASVLLAADGSIRLKPASGKQIVLEGDLDAQRIRYQPAAGGSALEL